MNSGGFTVGNKDPDIPFPCFLMAKVGIFLPSSKKRLYKIKAMELIPSAFKKTGL